ncbi:uncharacterized protein V6R79_003444 [Siganus canaliculatus]
MELEPSCQTLHQHFFGSLKSLRLLRSGLAEIGCSWARRMQNLIHLDLSENPISYTVLQNLSHCSSLSFKSLKSLDLRKSNLTSLQSLCTPLSLTPALTQLDVSANNFSIIHYPHCLQVKKLNLSHSGITEELKVDSNRLPVLIDGTQINVSTLERLDTLHAARNPYHCNCTLRETVVFLNSTRSVIVEDYPEDFLCASPVTQQGAKIRNLAFEEDTDCVVVSEGRHAVEYKPGKDEDAKSFYFDQAVTLDNIQSLHPELLQPLTESISSGYMGALLICGASTEKINSLIDHTIIKQVLVNLFSRVLSQVKEEPFFSVSLLQFYPDGSAADLLSPNRQTLKPERHPVLGSLVGGSCEVCVSSAEETFTLYETCRDKLKAKAHSIYNRCSLLFSVAVEWKLHPEEVESEICRSRLQLFSLAGGAHRADLRGVNPLVKVVDPIQSEGPTSGTLLYSLLDEALTGNSRTVLIYCIHPQRFLDDGTSALTLAQKVKSLVTKPRVNRWCRRAAEQEIRGDIEELRTRMMSQGENKVQDTYKLVELTQNLQIVKNQSWEKRKEESKKIKSRVQNLDSPASDQAEFTDTIKYLERQLQQEMEEHIREGKDKVDKVQERVARIQQLRENLREETHKNGSATETNDLCTQSHLEYRKAEERRRKLEEDHGRLIQEEVQKMERDLAEEVTGGPQRELLVLSRERQVLVLQIEALRAVAQQVEEDLQDQYRRHQTELHCLREESLQVFRVFRQVSEEQRKMSESRYRSVLLEAVQDAVYLSAQNQQLQADNKQLRKALGELKDCLAVRRNSKAELSPQQQ